MFCLSITVRCELPLSLHSCSVFFINILATPEFYTNLPTLPLHAALLIFGPRRRRSGADMHLPAKHVAARARIRLPDAQVHLPKAVRLWAVGGKVQIGRAHV